MHQALEKNFDWIVPKNPFDECSEPKSVERGSSKTYMDKIQFLVEKTSNIDLDVSSIENTWFLLSVPSSKALKKSTLGR
jgi:hypothetical protein